MLMGKMPDHPSLNRPVYEGPHHGKNDGAGGPQGGLGDEGGDQAGDQCRADQVSNQHLGRPSEAVIRAPEMIVVAIRESSSLMRSRPWHDRSSTVSRLNATKWMRPRSGQPVGSMTDVRDYILAGQRLVSLRQPFWSPRRPQRSRRSWPTTGRPQRHPTRPWCHRRPRAWWPR